MEKLMKSIAFVVFCSLVMISSVHADELLEMYVARLGIQDHYNSQGVRLDSAAAIIRQDRANYHRFKIRDPEDMGEKFFLSTANRAFLERMLNKGYISKDTEYAILNSTPVVVVKIFNGYIKVYVK